MTPSKPIQRIIVLIISLILIVSCHPGAFVPEAPTRANVTSLASTVTPTVGIPAEGLSLDQIETLRSLEMVDDYPLYTMRYIGDYHREIESGEHSDQAGADSQISSIPTNWACSLFAALGDTRSGAYGRNFDWQFSPALLLFTDPPDGYASISMVNLAFIRNWGDEIADLTNLPLNNSEALLWAPFLPIDGMNEYGLVVGMAAVPHHANMIDPDKGKIGSLGVIREMLDHARNVEEAIDILESYNIDWGGGPPIHYLVADRTGRSALVEFFEHEMLVFQNEQPWQQATNFLVASAGESVEGNCWRYDMINQHLNQTQGQLNFNEAMDLLEKVSQSGTQWSIVYGMHSGDIHVSMGHHYEHLHTFHLNILSD